MYGVVAFEPAQDWRFQRDPRGDAIERVGAAAAELAYARAAVLVEALEDPRRVGVNRRLGEERPHQQRLDLRRLVLQELPVAVEAIGVLGRVEDAVLGPDGSRVARRIEAPDEPRR